MAEQVAEIMVELERFASRVVAKIALDVQANLIEATPVDTGWARANWVPALGGPVSTPDTPPRADAAAEVSSARAGQEQATLALVSGYQITLGRVFISNGVPYITRLNEGSSTQAPAGFVQTAIAKALSSDLQGFRG